MMQYIKKIQIWLKESRLNSPWTILATAAGLLIAGLTLYISQPANEQQYIAKVNGIGIPSSLYNSRLEEQLFFFESANQPIEKQAVTEQVINTLIREQIVSEYAERRNISASKGEANTRFAQVAQSYKDEQALLDAVEELYGKDKEAYMATLTYDILRERVAASVTKEYSMSFQDWLSQKIDEASIIKYTSKN